MSKTNLEAYFNEPADYNEIRNEAESLMKAIKGCKDRLQKIIDLPIVQEQFQKEGRETITDLTKGICLLGEIHGYLLADDVLESVSFNNR